MAADGSEQAGSGGRVEEGSSPLPDPVDQPISARGGARRSGFPRAVRRVAGAAAQRVAGAVTLCEALAGHCCEADAPRYGPGWMADSPAPAGNPRSALPWRGDPSAGSAARHDRRPARECAVRSPVPPAQPCASGPARPPDGSAPSSPRGHHRLQSVPREPPGGGGRAR